MDIRMNLKKYWEVMWIRIAIKILQGRNVARCRVVSRRDNNDMWYMSEKLDSICGRMIDEYQTPTT